MDELTTRVALLERGLEHLNGLVLDEKRRLNGNLERIGKTLIALAEKLDAVKSEALRKPSWGTVVAITALASAVVGLLVYLIR